MALRSAKSSAYCLTCAGFRRYPFVFGSLLLFFAVEGSSWGNSSWDQDAAFMRHHPTKLARSHVLIESRYRPQLLTNARETSMIVNKLRFPRLELNTCMPPSFKI